MKKLILIVIVSFNILSCDGQQTKTVVNNQNTTDKLTYDIKKFEANKGKQGYHGEYRYKLPDNSNVREYSTTINANSKELLYKREITKKYSPYKKYYTFYENSLMYAEVTEFNNSLLEAKEFDRNGKLIKEINDDKIFKHTFEQIHDIALKEKKVDIFDTGQAVALRHVGPFTSTIKQYYQIHVLKSFFQEGEWYSQPNYSFIIDDTTGKIYSHEEINKTK